jgi:hypothetical protein
VKLDPKLYRKYIQIKKRKPIMYVQLKKALYGTLQASLLFWKDLSGKLRKWGFEVNPNDWCVANKTINGKQCTMLWHVDDIKISHEDPEVVSQMIELPKGAYGKEAPLTITRGKIHEYLDIGMTIDYSTLDKVRITMLKYIRDMFEEIPEEWTGEAATPAANHLFEVNPEAKLLFLCKRARPDIQTAVAFLCTRVKSPDVDDWKKLRRVMMYLRGTPDLPLTLEAGDMSILKWWIDASFATHADMKSHTGVMLTLGKGAAYAASTIHETKVEYEKLD